MHNDKVYAKLYTIATTLDDALKLRLRRMISSNDILSFTVRQSCRPYHQYYLTVVDRFDVYSPWFLGPVHQFFASISIIAFYPIITRRTVAFYLASGSRVISILPGYAGVSMRSNGLSLVRHWASWEVLFYRCIFLRYFPRERRAPSHSRASSSTFPRHFTVTSQRKQGREIRGYGYAKILGCRARVFVPPF